MVVVECGESAVVAAVVEPATCSASTLFPGAFSRSVAIAAPTSSPVRRRSERIASAPVELSGARTSCSSTADTSAGASGDHAPDSVRICESSFDPCSRTPPSDGSRFRCTSSSPTAKAASTRASAVPFTS